MTHSYRKKPVVIEAGKFKGTQESAERIVAWITDNGGSARSVNVDDGSTLIFIQTLEGTMQADSGDYVICGVKGEFYPCKPDIFAASYDRVEATA